jgi:hypothetical protein
MWDQKSTAGLTSEARRQKQQAFMIELVERRIRARAQQIYEERGYVDGFDLSDWVQAESEILGKSILAPLYRRLRIARQEPAEAQSGALIMKMSNPDAALESRP